MDPSILFFEAVVAGDLETVKVLIDDIGEEDLRDGLRLAITYCRVNIAECLSSYGVLL